MTSQFIERSRYYLSVEYPVKLRVALRAVPPSVVWQRHNESSNSLGNLVVHLAGNVDEWIVGGLTGAAVERNRAFEFMRSDGAGAEELISELDSAVRRADAVLGSLDQGELGRVVTIQGREITVLAAIYHVVEHFAMHTGQIILIAKQHAPGSIRFYDDSDGLAVPLWGGNEGMPAHRQR